MKPFPILSTSRLELRQMQKIDAQQIVLHANNENISKHTLNIPYPYTINDALWWINHSQKQFEENRAYTFGIYLKESKEFIGGISLVFHLHQKASLGYWLAESFWNKGYTTEALKSILAFGFEQCNINKIFAQHIVENKASGRVMQKAGMLWEANLKEDSIKNGVFRNMVQYRLTKTEFETQSL